MTVHRANPAGRQEQADWLSALESFNNRLETVERNQRMQGQNFALLNEQAKNHRQVTKSINDDIANYKAYVTKTFTDLSEAVQIKLGAIDNAVNIGVNDSLNHLKRLMLQPLASHLCLPSSMDKAKPLTKGSSTFPLVDRRPIPYKRMTHGKFSETEVQLNNYLSQQHPALNMEGVVLTCSVVMPRLPQLRVAQLQVFQSHLPPAARCSSHLSTPSRRDTIPRQLCSNLLPSLPLDDSLCSKNHILELLQLKDCSTLYSLSTSKEVTSQPAATKVLGPSLLKCRPPDSTSVINPMTL